MEDNDAAFKKYKEYLRKDIASAFHKAVISMGVQANEIDWLAGNNEISK